jgi:hypothetical protein
VEAKKFFEVIFGDGEGEAVLVLPNREGKPTNDFWFSYPEQLEEMADFVWSNEHADVWFSPALFRERDRHKEYSQRLGVLGADADTCEPDNFRVYPDIVIESSPGRFQVYWIPSDVDDYAPEDVAKVNRRIAQVHKHQGCDPSYVNPAKLMRVPGTSNGKHPGAIVIVQSYDFTSPISVQAMDTLYPESEVADAYEASIGDMPDDLEEFIAQNRAKLLNGLPNSAGLRDLVFKAPHMESRSEALFRLMCELYRLGLDDKEVMAVAWGSPSNKFNGEDPRGLKGLWDTALLKAKTAAFDPDYEWDIETAYYDNDEPAPRKEQQFVKKIDFLTNEEQELVSSIPNFIDEWVTWAGTKTDSPAEYHRAAAMALLSAVYSEFGHATPQWGPMKLNLWFMVLGRSTLDRKSTARSYMNKAFRALKTEDYNYSIGDDVTPGGISLALHDRGNKATVFDRDEVQGLFKELLHQSYMSGGLEVFTKLYDGWSGGRVRASGEKKIQESVPVSFIMFMMGILTESADVLTVTNFRSGFLTRFLYVVGHRPEGYVPPPIQQSKEEEDKSDPVFDGMMSHLSRNRDYWEMYGGDGDTVPIRATDEAWARYQKFETDVRTAAGNTLYAEVIATTSERTTHSTLKLAALLAMDDRSKRIELKHMLQAIGYAGEWITNAMTMATMVSESEWQRDVDKLEQFINSKGGIVSYAVAYRHFQDKRPFEFEEMIAALEQRGVLTREKDGSRWTLKVSYGD